jgi:hypothetical protein
MTTRPTVIENFLTAITPGGIEAQEKRGQQALVNSDILPKQCPKKELQKLGFKFLGDHDDIFLKVEMPKGWKKEKSDHDMWSYLIDDRGRRRAFIFYKAAFYDRSANMGLYTRFSSSQNYDLKDALQFFVMDEDNIIYATATVKFIKAYDEAYILIERELDKEVMDWLSKNYPDYKNVLAYWD